MDRESLVQAELKSNPRHQWGTGFGKSNGRYKVVSNTFYERDAEIKEEGILAAIKANYFLYEQMMHASL